MRFLSTAGVACALLSTSITPTAAVSATDFQAGSIVRAIFEQLPALQPTLSFTRWFRIADKTGMDKLFPANGSASGHTFFVVPDKSDSQPRGLDEIAVNDLSDGVPKEFEEMAGRYVKLETKLTVAQLKSLVRARSDNRYELIPQSAFNQNHFVFSINSSGDLVVDGSTSIIAEHDISSVNTQVLILDREPNFYWSSDALQVSAFTALYIATMTAIATFIITQ